jgi:hypothetical protein
LGNVYHCGLIFHLIRLLVIYPFAGSLPLVYESSVLVPPNQFYFPPMFRKTLLDIFGQHLLRGRIRRVLDRNTFYTDNFGVIMSSPDYPVLNLDGCERIRGAKKDWYTDAGPRLNTWLIPVVLLIANMEVSPLDKRRYWMVIHLLGDPVDSLWSLLSKIEAWSRCYSLARFDHSQATEEHYEVYDVKILATVLGGIEELLGPTVDPLSVFDTLIPREARQSLSIQVSKVAFKLADVRTDELIRTFFAVALYLYQVIAAFISVVGGGNTSPPGGRIETSIFITWLVPIILLSNAVGGFTSRTSCFDTMRDFCTEARSGLPLKASPESRLTKTISESNEYFNRKAGADPYTPLSSTGVLYSVEELRITASSTCYL